MGQFPSEFPLYRWFMLIFVTGFLAALRNPQIVSGKGSRVRVSFSAPNASQSCGAFLFVGGGAGDLS